MMEDKDDELRLDTVDNSVLADQAAAITADTTALASPE